MLDRPLEIAADSDVGAALGAARLAICAAEGADPAEVCAAPEILRTIEPDPALVPRYREGYARYRALYPALGRQGRSLMRVTVRPTMATACSIMKRKISALLAIVEL